MTADERLALVQFKIERAKKHISDLQGARGAFLNANPYEVRTKRDSQTRKLIYYVSKVGPTPICLATITGILIERCAAEYKSRLPRKVKGMRQDAIDAFNAIEPYKGGKGHDFWIIHELNNIDKHRLLVTVSSSFRSVNLGALMARHFEKAHGKTFPVLDFFVKPADILCPLKVGDELFIDAPNAEVNEKMEFRFDVALSELSIGESKPLLETVQHFYDLVSNTVVLFKPCLV